MIHRTRSTRGVLLGPWHKRTLYAATAFLWFTGVFWLIQPTQPLWMRVHGAAAMGFLMAFGALLLGHVPLGWQENSQRPSGVLLLGLSGVLIGSGWVLYYAVDRQIRGWTGKIHWILGLIFPILVLLHALFGRRKI